MVWDILRTWTTGVETNGQGLITYALGRLGAIVCPLGATSCCCRAVFGPYLDLRGPSSGKLVDILELWAMGVRASWGSSSAILGITGASLEPSADHPGP